MRVAFFDYSLLYESLSIANLMGALKAYGHECELFVITEEKNLLKSVKRFNPGLLCFTSVNGVHHISFRLAKYFKKHMDALTIFGGPHVTIFPEECIKEDCVDIVCRGEGELPLIELADLIDKGKDYSRIRNLWVKKGEKIIRNEVRTLIQDLDSLPLPDRSAYFKYPVLRNTSLKRFITGYGCPYQCSFCHNSIFLKDVYKGKGSYLRKKSVDRVFKEIKEVQKIARMERIHFHDDHFNFHRKWLEEFCNRYPNEIGIPFSCTIRVDIIDEPTVKMMKKAGCVGISYGLETANEKTRNGILNKNLTNKDFRKAAELFKKYNIKQIASIMLNLPGESVEDAFKTLHYLQELEVFLVRAAVYTITKKQPLVDMLIEENLIDKPPEIDNFNQARLEEITLNTPKLQQLIRLSPFFNVMLKFSFFEPLIKVMINFPIRTLGKLGRLYDGYLEMRFMDMPILQGLYYYYKVKKGFNAYQNLR